MFDKIIDTYFKCLLIIPQIDLSNKKLYLLMKGNSCETIK